MTWQRGQLVPCIAGKLSSLLHLRCNHCIWTRRNCKSASTLGPRGLGCALSRAGSQALPPCLRTGEAPRLQDGATVADAPGTPLAGLGHGALVLCQPVCRRPHPKLAIQLPRTNTAPAHVAGGNEVLLRLTQWPGSAVGSGGFVWGGSRRLAKHLQVRRLTLCAWCAWCAGVLVCWCSLWCAGVHVSACACACACQVRARVNAQAPSCAHLCDPPPCARVSGAG